MPTGKGFSILFSHLCLQTRCAAAVEQTNKQVGLREKKKSGLLMSELSKKKAALGVCETVCEDLKWLVS